MWKVDFKRVSAYKCSFALLCGMTTDSLEISKLLRDWEIHYAYPLLW
ncbi:hypothetical protein VCR4J5_180081 [Vibrio crassostreae]|uniref:Uncharacterized protein n=1 Tax=Vibrio crassostreae TaxID=246167 RepID=A0A822N497_9VIBR|nr:hypothetical protein VCRA2119O245_10054 [Vibrio crassostreae]CDT35814.1 hypothetical protein VCR1J2_430072 [Vibrio coralliirubri]CAK1894101.1 hypothetical protein VCRA2113O201_10575 [Vibrio crassostreae]CAK2298514.1 hypothetical protein VCRA2110O176_10575 [Vibrio crassostreae]CAK2433699.1 hypothetical protein VCRA2113O214_10054 [Vibrio crassostreae]